MYYMIYIHMYVLWMSSVSSFLHLPLPLPLPLLTISIFFLPRLGVPFSFGKNNTVFFFFINSLVFSRRLNVQLMPAFHLICKKNTQLVYLE